MAHLQVWQGLRGQGVYARISLNDPGGNLGSDEGIGTDMTPVCAQSRVVHKRILRDYVAWLQKVPWQLFCTFTFTWSVSDPQATAAFSSFIDRLDTSLRCPIAYVRGDEKRYSGCGKPGAPRHFHALLASACRLDDRLIANVWMDMGGHRENGAGANVRIYDRSLEGLAYTLKFINQPDGNWDLRNLDLFLVPPSLDETTSRQRRRLTRNAERAQRSSGALFKITPELLVRPGKGNGN